MPPQRLLGAPPPPRACVVLRNVTASPRGVRAPGVDGAFALGSRFFQPQQRLAVQPSPPARRRPCVPRAAAVAPPGDYGCRQVGHFLYNLVMPLWDSLRTLGWDGGAHVHVFIDCRGRLRGDGAHATRRIGGTELANAPEFVAAAARVLSPLPLQSLPGLLQGTGTGCFDELLVGAGCSPLDHYSRAYKAEHAIAFRNSLAAAVLRTPLANPLGWRTSVSGRAKEPLRVLLVDRVASRRLLNAPALLDAMRRVPGVDATAARLVRFEGMPLHRQMRVAAAACFMFGMDGTGLFNANFMRPGCTVAHVFPFGTRELLPDKSSNFVRLWQALGLRVRRLDVTQVTLHSRRRNATRSCQACMHILHTRQRRAGGNRDVIVNDAVATRATAASPCAHLAPKQVGNYWMYCVLGQDTRLPPALVVQVVEEAVALAELPAVGWVTN